MEGIKNVFSISSDIGSNLISNLKNIFVDMASKIEEVLKDPFNSIFNFISNIATKLKNLIDNSFIGRTIAKTQDFFSNGTNDKKPSSINKETITNADEVIKNNIINKPIEKLTVQQIEERKQTIEKASGVEMKPTNAVSNDNSIVLTKGMNEIERMKVMMDFLINDFASIMANKIGQVIKPGTTPLQPSNVVIQ